MNLVHKIEIVALKLAQELLAGAYKSAFKGQGLEVDEVREYQPGDDVRTIDWKVTARTGIAHVKKFQEERQLIVMLVVDMSGSLHFGSESRLKSESVAEIAALIAFSAIKNNDRVGLVIFTDQIELYVPPRQGKRHILRLIRELVSYNPEKKKTDLEVPIDFLGHLLKRTAVCFFLSDFLAPMTYGTKLRVLAKHHDLIFVRIQDALEKNLPQIGLTTVKDAETDRIMTVDMGDKKTRKHYDEKNAERNAALMHEMQASKIGFLEMTPSTSYADALNNYFRGRKR